MCLYDVAERVLLRRFQTSANASLDGVRDQLDSRRVTDAGPLDLIDDAPSDDDDAQYAAAGIDTTIHLQVISSRLDSWGFR